jgi:hypothetical protein
VTVEFQRLLLVLIVPANESHFIRTVLNRTIRSRLGWDEQRVVPEMEAQTWERVENAWFSRDRRISAVTHRFHHTGRQITCGWNRLAPHHELQAWLG